MKPFRISHSGSLGDLVWQLPAIKDIARRHGHSWFELLLKVNHPADYSEPHPCGLVRLTKEFAESAIPLLKHQYYVSDCRIWQGESVDIDIDLFRLAGADLRQGDIATWPCLSNLCSPDLTEPWLRVADVKPSGRVLIARTKRYRNPALTYPRIGHFIGFEHENEMGLPWVSTPTLMDMAREIAGCRCLIGNQSLAMAIASALDVPRYLEWSPSCRNVQPHGKHCTPIWTQQQLDEVVKDLPKKIE